jgi:hypothetical protein
LVEGGRARFRTKQADVSQHKTGPASELGPGLRWQLSDVNHSKIDGWNHGPGS